MLVLPQYTVCCPSIFLYIWLLVSFKAVLALPIQRLFKELFLQLVLVLPLGHILDFYTQVLWYLPSLLRYLLHFTLVSVTPICMGKEILS